jgi:site-specific recombinase XerD
MQSLCPWRRPPNTVRARRSDWRVFIALLRRAEVRAPASRASWSSESSWRLASRAPNPNQSRPSSATSRPSRSRIRSPIYPIPPRQLKFKGAYRHLSRGRPSSQPKAALRGGHISHALEHLNTDHAASDLRAKALLATAYCTMARRAELVALHVKDLSFNAESGDGVALIRNTKAGREESRYLSHRCREVAEGLDGPCRH